MAGLGLLPAGIHVGTGLLVLLLLLFDYVLDLEPASLAAWHLPAAFFGHVEDLEEGEVVQALQIDAFQDDLGDDELDVLLLQLDLGQELEQVFLGNRPLPVLPVGHGRQDLLIVASHQLGNLQEHLLLFGLGRQLEGSHQLPIVFQDTPFTHLGLLRQPDHRGSFFHLLPATHLHQQHLHVPLVQHHERLGHQTLHQLLQAHLLSQLLFCDLLNVQQVLLRLLQAQVVRLEPVLYELSHNLPFLITRPFYGLRWKDQRVHALQLGLVLEEPLF